MYDESGMNSRIITSIAILLFVLTAVITLYHFGKCMIDGAFDLKQAAISEAANNGKGSAGQTEQTSETTYDVTVPRTDNFSVIDANGNSQVIFEDQVTFNIYNK